MRLTRRALTVVASLVGCLTVLVSILDLQAETSLPASLSDQDFWALTEQLSEPNGFFRSENLLSNERGYQTVIPALLTLPAGGVYLGVGPEQNFPYIVALNPRMAFIIDIRRGNLLVQLLYKALFEISDDRADYLSHLFSRKRPSGLTAQSTVAELFAAYDQVPASEDLYLENVNAVIDHLVATHHFTLSDADIRGIKHVYRDGFFAMGPNLNYAMAPGIGLRNSPTYEELMLATDGEGVNRGYLATEEHFAFLKDLQTRNLVVPIVGDFGGPKAVRAVGQYVRDHGGTVAAFYVSNVEQSLDQSATWRNFCASVATLPLDVNSTYIFSGRGAPNGRQLAPSGGGLQTNNIRPILSEVQDCAGASR